MDTNKNKLVLVLFVFIRVHSWLIILATVLPALWAADEWPQFRGNPQLTGVAAGAVPANLKLLWTYEAGDSIESSAAISGNTVYVGSQTADLLAIDLQTGKLKWKYHVQEGIAESSPAVHDGIVYVGDSSGLLHAVTAADGKGLWTFKTEGEIKSSPVVAGDRVLIGSYDGNLYCLSARDGKLVWKYTTTNFVHATPAIDNGVIYLGGCDEVFRGIRLADGQEVLKFPSGGYTGASPVLVGKRAYYGTFSNDVIAADLGMKRIVWRYTNPARSFPFYSSAAASGDRVVLGGRDKLVYCLNAKTGKPIWTFVTRARVDSSPALASGRVYIGSNDGHFYVLDLADGKKALGLRSGRAALRVSGGGGRPRGHRLAGRAPLLLWSGHSMSGQGLSARWTNISIFGVASFVTSVLFINFCATLFRCGCVSLWSGADVHCNIHMTAGRHCPWCLYGRTVSVVPWILIIAAQAAVSFWPLPVSAGVRLIAASAAFPIAGTLVAVVYGLSSGYWR